MRGWRSKLKMTIAVAAAAFLLLPLFWAPGHTCVTQTAGRAPCLGCLWGVLTTFVVPLALTVALVGEAWFRAAWLPARAQFLALPVATGRSPPSLLL